ncbi:MAG TPA: nuclear transport factor 2 family protein [Candidatus Acidoferrales bacterium]|nr:nuclear transport factor 2 family protein [Candidatus Acidoferrales bacterium]
MRIVAACIVFAAGAALATCLAPPARAGQSDARDAAAIRAVLDMQVAAWNRGDVATFMTSYWKSDRTEFVGASGVFRGWQAVLDRYRKTYPDRKTMGQVHFSDLEIHVTSPATAFVVGQYHLQRQSGPVSGVFTLEFRKFADGWKIIVDHTTAFAAPAAAKAAHEPLSGAIR